MENGVVDQPRVVSGGKLTEFMELAVISELKFHFNEYLNWVYSSAPVIRNFTGSEMSAAVQRYIAVTVSKEITDNKMILKLGNFHDEAQLQVRFNEKEPLKTDGGKLTHLTGDLYLLEANKDTVTVSVK